MLGTLFPEDDAHSETETLDIADRLLATFPSAIAYHYNFHFHGLVVDTKQVCSAHAHTHILALCFCF